MRDAPRPNSRIVPLLFVLACLAGDALDAGAACNEPPDPALAMTGGYAGSSGTISSPFLIPGDVVGQGNVARTTTISANAGSTHGPATGDVLTVAIRDSSPQIAAVFAANCSAVAACNPAVPCHSINSLSFGTSPASVTFENSDVLEKLTRTGPVRLAVTPPANVPCTLAAQACPAVSATMHACIDDVTPGTLPNYDVESVTALPEPNEFSKFCKSNPGSGCGKTAGAIRYTIDLRGDMLVPFDWAKLTKKQGGGSCKEGDSCDMRKVLAATNLSSGLTSPPIIQIDCSESQIYLQSFSAAGTAFSPGPLFQAAPDDGSGIETKLLGSIDKAFSVLRIRRCPQGQPTCTTPKFNLALGAADYLEIDVPAGKTGTCSGSGNECSKTDPCPTGEKCTWFDGEDGGPLASQPPIVCTLDAGGDAGGGEWVWIILIIGGVVVIIWIFRKKS